MRPSTEVDKVWAQSILGKDLSGALLDQLALHPIVPILLKAFTFSSQFALKRKIFCLQFTHARLDFLQIFGREFRLPLKIVIKSCFGRRANTELRFRVKLEHSGSK